MARPVYHITAKNGHVYEVEAADDRQAEKIANFIDERISAGDPELKGGNHPVPMMIENGHGETAPETSAPGAFLRGINKGGTLNWNDEITAFGDAAGLAPIDNATLYHGSDLKTFANSGGFWDAFHKNLDILRNTDAADAEQHPLARGAGTVVGTIATINPATASGRLIGNAAIRAAPRAAIPLAARMSAAAIGAPVRTAMAEGAATAGGMGVVAGAGEGDTLASRGKSAALGGSAGLVLGAGSSGLIAGLGPAVARYWNMLRGNNTEQEAVSQIIRALGRDGFDVTSPSGVQAVRQELGRFTNKPVSLADVGSSIRARAGVGLRSPSGAQEHSIDAVIARSQGQNARLARDVRANVAPRTDVHALDDALVEQRAQQAAQLRDRALFVDGPAPEPVPQIEVRPTGGVAPEAPDAGVRRALGLNPPEAQPIYERTTVPPQTLYRGGAPYDPAHNGLTYFTPDRQAAESYANAHMARFGREGVVEQGHVNITNPAPYDVVVEEAKKLGLETNLAPASIFDPVLQGRRGSSELVDALRRRGYDGTILDDMPFDASGKTIQSHLPFSQQQIKIAAPGRQSRIVNDPQLQQLARLPDAQAALQAAVKRAEAERLLLGIKGESTDHIPDIHPGAQLDVRTFDYLKRHLDDEVGALYRGADTQTFKAGQAAQVRDLRNAIRDRLRQVVPEYGDYLDAYSGSSDMIDSLRAGRDYTKLDPEVIAAEQGKRSTAAQELYRVGAARDLLDTIDATPHNANAASRVLRTPEEEAQLAATGASVDPLHTSVHQERQLNLLPAEIGGSQTAGRMAAEADANHQMDLMIPFNPTSTRGWLGAVARMAGRHLSTTRNAAVNEALLPRVLETNPAAIDGVIAELEAGGQKASADALRRLKTSRRVSQALGITIGAPVALPEGDR